MNGLNIKRNRDIFIWSVLSVIIFNIITHGYRFSNNMYSHDSLLMIYQNDFAWQIALGRYVQPFLIFIRGSLCSPWLISICAIFWTSLSVYFLVCLLKIDKLVGVILTAGVLVCNVTVVVANASYLPWVDFYALACFLGIFGVWCLKQGSLIQNSSKFLIKKVCIWYLLGILALVCSMGIYQSYICVAIGLAMMDILADLLEPSDFKVIIKKIVSYVLSLIVVALVYYVVWKCIQKIFNIWTANSYNGLANVGDYSDTSIIAVLRNTYTQVFDFLWNPDTFKSLIYRSYSFQNIWMWILRLANLFIVGNILITIFLVNIKHKIALWQRVLQVVILLIFPFGINIVSFISKGMEHTLMIYAFLLIYILLLQLKSKRQIQLIHKMTEQQDIKEKGSEISFSAMTKYLVFVLPFCLLIWSNIVYANQVYLKKELQAESTSLLMTRVVDDIEDMQGYIPGKTPVALYGNFQTSNYVRELPDFEEITPYGMGKSSVTYIGADYSLLNYVLNVNMNLTRVDMEDAEVMKQIDTMPCYPEKGSIDYIGDILVVKIAEF